MNHKLTLTQAIEGYMLYKQTALSPNTLAGYQIVFEKLQRYLPDDPYLMDITSADISQFINYLGSTPQPMNGVAPRRAKPLSKKSLLNVHTALSSLWTWAMEQGWAETHIMRHVARPKPEKRAINPLSKADLQALLDACNSYSYERDGKTITAPRVTALRDKAIILLLVDTGLRVSELCRARIGDLDIRNHRLKVLGKGSKERILRMDARTTQAIWTYLTTRPEAKEDDPLFSNYNSNRRMKRRSVLALTKRLGDAANVSGCNPHRFRHTFAVAFLRNGGNIYALQEMLGHASLDMCKRYLAIAQADLEAAHRRASPVANWRL